MQQVFKVSKNIKWQYSLYNLFAPIFFAMIVINMLGMYNIQGSLFAFISLILGIFLCVYNLKKYQRRILLDDNKINIVEGTDKSPKLIASFDKGTIDKSNVQHQNSRDSIYIKLNGNKTAALCIFPSFSGLIFLIGPWICFLILAARSIKSFYAGNLERLIEGEKLEKENTGEIICYILFWITDIVLVSFGLIGILLMPFYPFFKNVQ